MAARQVIEEAGFGEFFIHNLGHGVGLDIHEAPILSPESKDILEKSNVVTIEPGIYIPGFGGVRIEDTILITQSGAEKLTAALTLP
jgi:Xaa-Pro aminopeptidase